MMLRESLEEHWVSQHVSSFYLISPPTNPRLIPNLYPPLRCPVYSHLTSLDGSVPDLCESILRGQRAPVAPSPALSRAAVGPSGPNAAAGLDQSARPSLFHAFRKGMKREESGGGVEFMMELINHVQFDNECFYPQVSEGLVLRDGARLKYPINGIIGSWWLFCFLVFFFWSDCDYDTC